MIELRYQTLRCAWRCAGVHKNILSVWETRNGASPPPPPPSHSVEWTAQRGALDLLITMRNVISLFRTAKKLQREQVHSAWDKRQTEADLRRCLSVLGDVSPPWQQNVKSGQTFPKFRGRETQKGLNVRYDPDQDESENLKFSHDLLVFSGEKNLQNAQAAFVVRAASNPENTKNTYNTNPLASTDIDPPPLMHSK